MASKKIDTERALFAEYPPFAPITQGTRDNNTKRIFTGGVRINNGMYRTKEEDAEYRKTSLDRKLP